MFLKKTEVQEVKDEKTKLDELIEDLEKELTYMDPKDKDYATVAENLGRLMELKKFREISALEKEEKKQDILEKQNKPPVDGNTLAQGAFLLVGMLMCIRAEQVGTITTKAFTLVPRLIGLRRV